MSLWDELDKRIKRHLRYDNEPCAFNPAVMCEGPGERCKKCGWNPHVCERRMKRILAKLGVKK